MQVTLPVQWESTLKTMRGKGFQSNDELGPRRYAQQIPPSFAIAILANLFVVTFQLFSCKYLPLCANSKYRLIPVILCVYYCTSNTSSIVRSSLPCDIAGDCKNIEED